MAVGKYYFYVDGVEYDTQPIRTLFSEGFAGIYRGLAITQTFSVAPINDPVSAKADVDDWHVGTTGYDTTDVFSDAFGGSGFGSWDDYDEGSPTNVILTETAGVARLDTTAQTTGVTALISNTLDMTGAPALNTYWTCQVKGILLPTLARNSPKISVEDGVDFGSPTWVTTAFLGADRVRFRTAYGGTTVADYDVMVDLDDGSFHTVAIRRQWIPDEVASLVVSLSHTFGLDV